MGSYYISFYVQFVAVDSHTEWSRITLPILYTYFSLRRMPSIFTRQYIVTFQYKKC